MKNRRRFWDLHFDFHAKNEDELGVRTEAEDIERYLLAAKPDFTQCDSRSHEGNSSYPTKVGKQAALIKSDNLRVWRDVLWCCRNTQKAARQRALKKKKRGKTYEYSQTWCLPSLQG